MPRSIHPEYTETTIACACGAAYQTRSTRQNIRVEICAQCHPFFTGKQKLLDSAGRVDKFQKRFAKKTKLERDRKSAKEEKEAKNG